ncbi:Mannosylfructose-phosphate synthase [compost metagenome]
MNRPLRILHYIPVYAPAWRFGGPVMSVSKLCEGLATLGHSVEVITSNATLDPDEFPAGATIDRNGVRITYHAHLPGLGLNCPGMERAVEARAAEFDIIHVTGVWQRTSGAACRAASMAHVPYVVSPRGALGPYSWKQKAYKKIPYYLLHERRNLTGATAVHYTAQQELEECKWLKLPGEEFVVPNGIDMTIWAPPKDARQSWRISNGMAEDCFMILSVGRLHHKKGLDLLPMALAPLRGLNWKLVIVGDDEDGTGKALKAALASVNLSAHVHFLDAMPPQALAEVYAAADLFVLPSRHENFGNVVVEAIACGCPALVSDQVGLHREIALAGMGWSLPREWRRWSDQFKMLYELSRQGSIKPTGAKIWANTTFDHGIVAEQMADRYMAMVR